MNIRDEMLKEYNSLMKEEIAIHTKRIALKSAISNYKEKPKGRRKRENNEKENGNKFKRK